MALNIYYEQYLIDDDPNRNKRKKTFFLVLYILSILILVTAVVFLYLTIITATEWLMFIFPLALLAMSIVSLVFVRRHKNRIDVDFDYVLSDESLRIIKVFNKRKRKLFLTLNVKSFSAMGKVNSDGFNRYFAMPNIKKVFANISEDEDKLYYAFYSDGPERTILLIEPDEQFLSTLRLAIGRDIMVKK